jgi:peptidoglycan/xylan/chitin deacetylase (PgdA/CDA1 family)
MPKLVQWIFSKRVWALPNNTNTVYLTFDDGPIPEVTPWVLSELKKYNAKATFFCIGDNINKHPAIFKPIIHLIILMVGKQMLTTISIML